MPQHVRASHPWQADTGQLRTGIGIPDEFLPEIFRPFYQVDSRQARQFQGTGPGLSISHRLIEAMGGTLTAESELGKGSIFRVSLPTHFSRHSQENFVTGQESSHIPPPLLRKRRRFRPACRP